MLQNGHADGSKGESARAFVDFKAGTVSREIFVNADIYAQEQEQLFARCWLFVGHASQVPKPGDFFVSCMGEESVILCRDRESEIHVFLNSCTHRGMKVCRYDEGNTPVFSCPYHGWSFATDGKLVGVPYFKDAYQGELDKSKWGLIEAPQTCNYKGAIWATWDASAPSFLEYMGGYKTYLDFLLDTWDGAGGETEVFGGIEKWVIPCQLEVPGGEFRRRPLPQHQPPLRRPGGRRAQRQRAPRHPGARGGGRRWMSPSPKGATAPSASCAPTTLPSQPTSTPGSFPNISPTARASAGRTTASGRV